MYVSITYALNIFGIYICYTYIDIFLMFNALKPYEACFIYQVIRYIYIFV